MMSLTLEEEGYWSAVDDEIGHLPGDPLDPLLLIQQLLLLQVLLLLRLQLVPHLGGEGGWGGVIFGRSQLGTANHPSVSLLQPLPPLVPPSSPSPLSFLTSSIAVCQSRISCRLSAATSSAGRPI